MAPTKKKSTKMPAKKSPSQKAARPNRPTGTHEASSSGRSPKKPEPRRATTAVEDKPADKKKKDTKVPSIRIRLSAFDHIVLDEAAGKIVDTAQRSGAVIHGPIPLPTKIRRFTVNRSTFKHKDARDQFEMRTHRRLIDLSETTFKTIESLQNLSLPSGVDIEIKMN